MRGSVDSKVGLLLIVVVQSVIVQCKEMLKWSGLMAGRSVMENVLAESIEKKRIAFGDEFRDVLSA